MLQISSNSKDVKLSVLESLPHLIVHHDLTGWVRSSDIPNTKILTDELIRLSAENKQLKLDLAHQIKLVGQKKDAKHLLEDEFQELISILDSASMDFSNLKDEFGLKIDSNTISVLRASIIFKDWLMNGVTNQVGMSEITKFIFFDLCPKLQIHELVTNEAVPKVEYRRYAITKRGQQFFAYVEKKMHKSKGKTGMESMP